MERKRREVTMRRIISVGRDAFKSERERVPKAVSAELPWQLSETEQHLATNRP